MVRPSDDARYAPPTDVRRLLGREPPSHASISRSRHRVLELHGLAKRLAVIADGADRGSPWRRPPRRSLQSHLLQEVADADHGGPCCEPRGPHLPPEIRVGFSKLPHPAIRGLARARLGCQFPLRDAFRSHRHDRHSCPPESALHLQAFGIRLENATTRR